MKHTSTSEPDSDAASNKSRMSDNNITDAELSQFSSNDSAPVPFTGETVTPNPHTRRHSITRSFESIRSSFNQSRHANEPEEGYTCKEIYGDLGESQIQIQRLNTRATVLSELASRANIDFEFPGGNKANGLESANNSTNTSTTQRSSSESPKWVQKHSPVDDVSLRLDNSGFPIEHNGEEFGKIDPELITFDGFDDPQDPRNWATSQKAFVIVIASLYTLVPPMSSSILTPAMSEIVAEFNIKSQTISAMIVSIQILAWAFGPLVIAPLSEDDMFGRRAILDISCWMTFFFNLGCAFSQNTSQMLLFRFLSGLFSSTALNVTPAVISDLFEPKFRTVSLACVLLLPLLGPVLAPVIGGYVVSDVEWRWVLYVLCIFNGVVAIVGSLLYKETFAPAILKRKARRLRKATGNSKLHTIYEISNGETRWSRMKFTMLMPLKLLFTHPLVIMLGCFLSFVYGFMYLLIVTFPTIYGNIYGFDKRGVGLMYLPMGVGFVLGVIVWTFSLQKVYVYLTNRNGGVEKPEFRLPCLIINTAVLIPLSLLLYGWSVERRLHWIVPAIGTGIFSFSFCCVFQSLQAVLIDSIRFAASAVAAAAVFRSFFGFAFPLFAGPMYDRLGYGWGNTLFAIVAVMLGVPFPIVLFKYGERIRNWANERMDREQSEREARNLQILQAKLMRDGC